MPHLNHQRGETRRSVNRETPCSCTMCGNPRRDGWSPSQTRAELKSELSEREWRGEPDRPRSRSKRKRRPYGIEQWSRGWWNLRTYSTEKSRDEALERLRKKGAPWDYRPTEC